MRSRERIGNALTFRLHHRWRRIISRSPRWRSHAGLEGKGNPIRMRLGKRKGLFLCSDIHSVGVDRMRIPFAQVLSPLPPGREVRSANTISSGGPGRREGRCFPGATKLGPERTGGSRTRPDTTSLPRRVGRSPSDWSTGVENSGCLLLTSRPQK